MNTASRMESTSMPGAIQVSATTWEMLAEHEEWQPTGGVEIKGKGKMETFLWVPPPDFLDNDAALAPGAHPRRDGKQGALSPVQGSSHNGSSTRLSSNHSSLHPPTSPAVTSRASVDSGVPSQSRLRKQTSADIAFTKMVTLTKSSVSSFHSQTEDMAATTGTCGLQDDAQAKRTSNRWLHHSMTRYSPSHPGPALSPGHGRTNGDEKGVNGLEILSTMLSIHSERKRAQIGLVGRKFASRKERSTRRSDGAPDVAGSSQSFTSGLARSVILASGGRALGVGIGTSSSGTVS